MSNDVLPHIWNSKGAAMAGIVTEIKRKTNFYNRMSFEAAQRKRQQLLDKIHDGFTPKEAMVIWNMKRSHVDIMTEKMRKYGMIVSSGSRCSRIFHKVNENAN